MHLAIGILGVLTLAADSPIRIETSDAGRVVIVSVDLEPSQLTEPSLSEVTARQGEAILTLRLIGSDGELGAPIFGDYRRVASQLHFQPRYRLVPEYAYRATFHGGGRVVSLDYRVPKHRETEAARVERVFPSGAVLPANHLKFYIHFSQPMREGRAIFDHIHLLREDGSHVPDPWRRTELWTDDARRLTLWIHPGRVKTGVNLREELGPVLEPNHRYTLVLDSTLQDANGQSLGEHFEKKFETTAADRDRPQPAEWQLHRPPVATRQPLRVSFNESLDHALSQRFIKVESLQGKRIAGQIVVGVDEVDWSFIPDAFWRDEEYRLVVNPLLEDLAGNTPERVFDTDLNAAPATPPILVLPFQPRLAN